MRKFFITIGVILTIISVTLGRPQATPDLKVPIDARALWIDTVASIPAGWSRDTDYDDRFPQGSSSAAGETGGGSHLHTQSHGLVCTGHTHTITGSQITDPFSKNVTRDIIGGGAASTLTHAHEQTTSNSSTITYSNDTQSTSSVEAKPPFTRAIIIKPNDANQDFPAGAICFTEGSTPGDFVVTDGSGSTPDLGGRYILGAETGQDATSGGSPITGGSLTHTGHTLTSDHTPNNHSHDATTSGGATLTTKVKLVAVISVHRTAHHTVALLNESLDDVSGEVLTIDAGSSEPEYYQLYGVQNNGTAQTVKGLILPYTGTRADVSEGWALFAKVGDRQVKVTTDAGTVGTTGGNATQLHNVQQHQHTHTGSHDHDESVTNLTPTETDNVPTTIAVNSTAKLHNHTWTIGATTPGCAQTAAFDTDASDARYNYRTNLFVKCIGEPTIRLKGGRLNNILLMFIGSIMMSTGIRRKYYD